VKESGEGLLGKESGEEHTGEGKK